MSVQMNKRFMDVVKEDEQLVFFERLGDRKDIQSMLMYLHTSQLGHVSLKGKNYESLGLVEVSSGFIKVAAMKLLKLFNPLTKEVKSLFQTYRFDDYSVTIRYIDSDNPYYMISIKQ